MALADSARDVARLPGHLSWWTWLAIITLIGGAIRIAFLVLRLDVMETEGQCYVRIAENLANGLGQLGIRAEGLQLFYPPLYPWLISLLIHAGLSSAAAAHAISLVAGTLLSIPLAVLGRIAFTPTIGLTTAFLVAVHPALVVTSASTLAEALYLLLVASAVAAAATALSSGRLVPASLAGACAGLAYLIRAEGLAVFVLGALVIVIGFHGSMRARLRLLSAFSAAFLLFATPYVAYLTETTGRFRLETKSPENILIGERVAQGVPGPEIAFGVNTDLTVTGTALRSNLDVMREADSASMNRLHFLKTLGLRNAARGVDRFFSSRVLGQPVLALLAFLGMFAAAWPRERLLAMAVPLGLAAATFAALTTLHLFWVRYVFPVLPWLIVLAAAGLAVLSRSVRGTFLFVGFGERPSAAAGAATAVLALAVAIGVASRGMHEIGEFSEAWAPSRVELRQAGVRLRGLEADMRIADVEPTVAYYAGATFEFYPYSDAATAVKYLDSRGIDFAVIRAGDQAIPYLAEWYATGPPPDKARHLFTVGNTRVYRWLR